MRARDLAKLAAFALGLGGGRTRSLQSSREPATATEWHASHKAPLPPPPPEPVTAPSGTWVLHIGDSFVDAFFQQNLRPRFRETGTRYVSAGKVATYTTTWAFDPTLRDRLAQRPALVIVTLGANEVDIPEPEDHARAIATLARRIAASGAACVWTSPPMWKRDKGILQVIHDHAAPCVYFDSDAVMGSLSAKERKPDRIHPNEQGGARWAAAFWQWLLAHRDPKRGPWAIVPFEKRGLSAEDPVAR